MGASLDIPDDIGILALFTFLLIEMQEEPKEEEPLPQFDSEPYPEIPEAKEVAAIIVSDG